MKNFLNMMLILLFFSSCTKETEFAHLYVIKNETSHDMEITGYDVIGDYNIRNTGDLYSETISISKNSLFEVVRQAGWRLEDQSAFSTDNIDSLVIRFDSVKQIVYSCNENMGFYCSGKYNLMNIEENYVAKKIGKSSGKDEYSYTYTFTHDDYENASVIE
ncbi:MAG: hypothetical protein PHP30_10385 [Bacteroidales bacterium]|nr:hypothetical protein [Bacteroidales bacterium]